MSIWLITLPAIVTQKNTGTSTIPHLPQIEARLEDIAYTNLLPIPGR